jgi:hypothetical protein
MPIYVSDGGGGTFVPHPVGLHQMVCCDVIDNGVCDTAFGPKRKITIRWQSQELNPKGQRLMVQKRYTASLNEKASLRHDLDAWRGKAFTEPEARKFDVELLIGANAMVNVVHRAGADGKIWANVASLSPLMKGLPKMEVVDYERQKDRNDTPEPNEVPPGDDAPPITDSDIPFAWLMPLVMPALTAMGAMLA